MSQCGGLCGVIIPVDLSIIIQSSPKLPRVIRHKGFTKDSLLTSFCWNVKGRKSQTGTSKRTDQNSF